jgi:hypothetical protein
MDPSLCFMGVMAVNAVHVLGPYAGSTRLCSRVVGVVCIYVVSVGLGKIGREILSGKIVASASGAVAVVTDKGACRAVGIRASCKERREIGIVDRAEGRSTVIRCTIEISPVRVAFCAVAAELRAVVEGVGP